ncbi:MAG TPA: hypothetical protein VFK85_03570 [Anaeromyxobacteraceae bacterium]|nr:hypothetical protein [Anaeromyxobacteraceae bacterium]
MSFDRARQIADAVLLEGYVLYPYRASSTKNRYRFTFGVLAPRSWSEAGGCESWWMEAQCLVECADRSGLVELEGKLRFLHARRRRVLAARDGDGGVHEVESLDVDGRRLVSWDEGDVREVELRHAITPAGSDSSVPFEVEGGSETELVHDRRGALAATVERDRAPVRGTVWIRAQPVAAERPLVRLHVRVENETPWQDPCARRDDALRSSCIATHLLLAVSGGEFVSLLDPPGWAAAAAASCRNTRTFPVLAGEPGRRDLVLASPIILYDHPQIAPESAGDLFDATEIDEILTLRTAALTDEEKRDARATDARAAAIVDRVDGMPPELLARLHGAARDLLRAEMIPKRSSPARAGNDATAAGIGPGSRVRLRPGVRRADAQDLLYAGCTATVRVVRRDVDGRDCLAVTIDGDPAAELHDWYGRYHHFFLDEVEPLPDPRVEGGGTP